MVHRVHNGRHVTGHVCFIVPGLRVYLGIAVIEIIGIYVISISIGIAFIKSFEARSEKAECAAHDDLLRTPLLEGT